jgi:hypothetical protein
MKWAYVEPTGIIDLNVTSASLGAKMRRIYEVVDVLEGLGLMKKTGVNEVRTFREYEPGQHIELWDLEADEDKLDALIEQA